MALYSLAVASTATLTVAPIAEIRAGTGARVRLLELGVFCNAATTSAVGLIRASNTPVASTSQLFQPYDTGDPASISNIDTAWSTAPTVGTVYLRRVQLPAAIGAGVIWQFDDLVLGPHGTAALVLWNFSGATNSVLQIYAVIDE